MGDIIATVIMGALAIGGFLFLGVLTLLEKIFSGKGSGVMKAGVGAFFAKKAYDSLQDSRRSNAYPQIQTSHYVNQPPQIPMQSSYTPPTTSHIPPPSDCEGLR